MLRTRAGVSTAWSTVTKYLKKNKVLHFSSNLLL